MLSIRINYIMVLFRIQSGIVTYCRMFKGNVLLDCSNRRMTLILVIFLGLGLTCGPGSDLSRMVLSTCVILSIFGLFCLLRWLIGLSSMELLQVEQLQVGFACSKHLIEIFWGRLQLVGPHLQFWKMFFSFISSYL